MLDLEFMRLAFAVGIVVGVLAPAVGFFLVERKQSLVGDGLGHVAFAGVAAGYLLGISPVLTALCFAVVGAFAIEWLRSRGGTAGDQALALVFYTGIALGIVLVSSANRFDVGLFQFLFGSILTVTWSDFWRRLKTALGTRRPSIHVPFWLARGPAAMFERMPPALLTRDQLRMLEGPDNVVSDGGGSMRRLGLDERVPLEEQLRRAVTGQDIQLEETSR